MSIFTVSAEVVQLGTGAIQPTDTFQNGVLLSGDLNRAIATGGDEYANGLLMTDAGQIRYFDATAGLPVGVVWSNGLPRANDGALCVSQAHWRHILTARLWLQTARLGWR